MALILIADDDKATRETLASLLRQQGHETYPARSAFELLDLADEHPHFDLVLTDLKMPRMDGIQLLETLRIRYPGARVVVMSAFSTADAVVAALRGGVADYLQKPFGWKELQDVLGRTLSGAAKVADRQAKDEDSHA